MRRAGMAQFALDSSAEPRTVAFLIVPPGSSKGSINEKLHRGCQGNENKSALKSMAEIGRFLRQSDAIHYYANAPRA